MGADERVAGCGGSEGDPNDCFLAAGVIVGQEQCEPGDERGEDGWLSWRCHGAGLLTVGGSLQRGEDEHRPGRMVVLNGPNRDAGLGRDPTNTQRVEAISGDHGDRAIDDPVTHDDPSVACECHTIVWYAGVHDEGGSSVDEIKGIARVKFHPGKIDDWKRLTEQAMDIVRTQDQGTLQYEIFFNEDESEAIVFERYRDADAALDHFANISDLMEPLMATADVTGEVLGTPNEKMRAQLGEGEPKLFTPWMALDE